MEFYKLVYCNDELYVSPSEFASKLSLSISEFAEYQKTKKISPSYVKIIKINDPKNSKKRRIKEIIAQNEVKRIRGGETLKKEQEIGLIILHAL